MSRRVVVILLLLSPAAQADPAALRTLATVANDSYVSCCKAHAEDDLSGALALCKSAKKQANDALSRGESLPSDEAVERLLNWVKVPLLQNINASLAVLDKHRPAASGARSSSSQNGTISADGGGVAMVLIANAKIQINERLYFRSGVGQPLSRASDLLDQLAGMMKNNPQLAEVTVVGHTDSNGPAKANLALSLRRAEEVKKLLVQRGVEPNRLVTRGHGEGRPLWPNHSEKGRAYNRRVEFRITRRLNLGPFKAAEGLPGR